MTCDKLVGILFLSALGSSVFGMSDRVYLTITIPPDRSTLQDYLCSGLLKSNMAIELDAGEHRIPSGSLCSIFNESNIALTGSLTKTTTVRCEGDEGSGFALYVTSVQNLTIKKITFINCGHHLQSAGNILFADCTFQNNPNGAISLISSVNTNIANCIFKNNSATDGYGGGAVWLSGSIINVSITNCTFQNNSATNGGAVALNGSTVDVSITNCTFQHNSAASGGAVWLDGAILNVNIQNCTFQNNVGNALNGGAVWLSGSTTNASITNCTFLNNEANFNGGAMCGFFESTDYYNITNDTLQVSTINIMGCTFLNNSAYSGGGGAVWLGGSTGNFSCTLALPDNSATLLESSGEVSLLSSTFLNNSALCGGAVLLYGLSGEVSIANTIFQKNSAAGKVGAVWLLQSSGNINITNCIFENNNATTHSGAVSLDLSNIICYIAKCTFQNNNCHDAGGAVGMLESSGEVSIASSTFRNNSAFSGGAFWVYILSGEVSITNTTFQNNNLYGNNGGAVGICRLSGDLHIRNCTFQNNSATNGAGIFLSTNKYIFIHQTKFLNNSALIGAAVFATLCNHLLLEDVMVNHNYHTPINTHNDKSGGAIYLFGVNASINGSASLGSQFSSNSPQGAIQGESGFLLLSGKISFTNNTGVNGGAISLSNNVPLQFHDKCNVQFSGNLATTFGGAIYNEGDQNYPQVNNDGWNPTCVIGFVGDGPFSITFTDNHAELAGHAVYAAPIYSCDNLNSHLTITSLPEDLNDTQVLSFPANVQLCGCSDPTMCSITSQYEGKVTTYPGRTVVLYVTSVDYANNISPSVVYTHIYTSGTVSPSISLGLLQSVQWIGSKCASMEYQIYGPENASLRLLLSNYPGYPPTTIEVQLLPCEPGFTLSTTGPMKCDCSPFLTSHGVVCDASDGTVSRHGTNWIGVYNNTIPALASTCPLDYCNNGITNLSLAGQPGDLCNGGRTGILCGHCYGNLSVIFGSSKCQVCSDMWLITLVMFAVLGVLLVAALFFLNLTVTQDTLYGLIFYANIVQVNTSIFFSQSILKPLQVIVSFVNLDLGLPLCFYDGMDDADKAGLQFVFPAYLLILTMAVIVVCHYCLQRSPTTSSSSCLYRLPIIIGERAVGVLSTLIYLSYSKLLRTVIDVFTYSTVHLPSGDINVWFFDGNVEYLHGKHITLFVVAMVMCTLFLLPYTLAITFIPIIERYSEHNRLFNYLHKKANQIKPMNDAHYAPYKGKWRWWLGARLWLLVAMNSLNAVYCSNQPSLLLSIQATMVILFMLAQAKVEPFGQSLQMANKYTRFYNQLYNCLDLFYLLNYTVLALSMSYILDHGSDQTQIVVCVGVLVGLFVVVLMVVVLYHLIVAILKACKMYDIARQKINRCFKRKYELMVSIDPNALDGLREPLTEDDD